MAQQSIAHPPIVARDVWLTERQALLKNEKELTRQRDRLNAERRRLPMVQIEKPYSFDTPAGQKSLADLFEGRRQLIVYHFMFDPDWDEGCKGCAGLVNAMGERDLTVLNDRDTTFVLISRAPLAKIERYRKSQGWRLPWLSSFGSDFNYDFHISLDEVVAPIEYNYRDKAELMRRNPNRGVPKGEAPGFSVFFQMNGDVFHCYSTFARGCEGLTDSYSLLDMTPYGRQEDFEESPAGWPQKPTYG